MDVVSRPLRLALLTNFIAPYRLPLLEALSERVSALRVLISTRVERDRTAVADWNGLDVVVQRGISVKRTWRTSRFAERLDLHVPLDTVARLRAFRPDVIVSGEMGARTTQAMLFGRRRGVPIYIWATLAEHLEVERDPMRQALRRWLLARASGVIVNGNSGASYIRRYDVPDERIAVVPQTTSLEAFQRVPLTRAASCARRILVVGRLSSGKGVDLLLGALAAVARRQPQRTFDICIIGDGPLRTQLQSMPLPPNARAAWPGHVDYGALPAYYARAGLLAFPTLGDEWGMVVNEALAAGLPVLGSRLSQAVEELVTDGENGWKFTPASVHDVAQALERAMQTPDEELERMRAAARAAVETLTPEGVADRFLLALHGGH